MPTNNPEKKEPKKPLSVTHPELAKEADGWDPSIVSYGSAKKVKWKCLNYHSYEAAINNRTNRESGCPYCSGQKVLIGFNDLKSTNLEYANFAYRFNPENLTAGSNQICEWICPIGHIWNEQVNLFVRRKPRCLICAGLILLSGFNDLKSKFPEIAKEAYDWNPLNVLPNEKIKKEWICEFNHKWMATPFNRAIKESGCPNCRAGKFLFGFNDLFSTFPEISLEAFGWDPKEINRGSNLNVDWKCSNGHIFKAVVSKRTRRGDGCPICSNHQLLEGFNDLQTVYPVLAKEAYGWDPKNYIYTDSIIELAWICLADHHIWESSISKRITNKRGCPSCNPSNSRGGKAALSVSHPEIAKEAYGWDPNYFSFGSSDEKEWTCNLGHIYKSAIYSRTSGSGCSICGRKSVLKGFNDLQTKFPEIASEAYEWDPAKIFPGSNKRREWKCKLGHIFMESPNGRTYKGAGCNYCSSHKVLIGFNDLETTHPELAKEADGWDPSIVITGSNKKVKWICQLGHKWDAIVVSRSRNESGCPYCSGNKVLVGFNDLETTHPELSKEAFGWDPKTVTAGSGKKGKWICQLGHKWDSVVGSRSGQKIGCPTCSKSGFDPNKDGYLYFVSHQDWEMFQIGITNVPDDRLKDHKKLGWEVLELRGPMDGHLTQQWETAILRMLKKKGADLSNEKIAGKFDGYSEAWTKATFPVESIKELMRLTDEFEEGLDNKYELG